MLKKLVSIFKFRKEEKFLKNNITLLFKEIPIDFGGGCSLQKAMLMSCLIKDFKIKKSIDLGVYRGRSFFPQAIAHKYFSNGIAYGIDPFMTEDAIQNDRKDLKIQLDHFVNTTDFESIYKNVFNLIRANQLENNSKLIRRRSDSALSEFEKNSIGLIHIDGNHDTASVLKDVENYIPLLEESGIIILDDVSWESVKPALDLIKKEMIFIGELIDNYNDFALFIKSENLDNYRKAQEVFNFATKQK